LRHPPAGLLKRRRAARSRYCCYYYYYYYCCRCLVVIARAVKSKVVCFITSRCCGVARNIAGLHPYPSYIPPPVSVTLVCPLVRPLPSPLFLPCVAVAGNNRARAAIFGKNQWHYYRPPAVPLFAHPALSSSLTTTTTTPLPLVRLARAAFSPG